MCGVPYHAADNYINCLVGKGYRVAICEQVEDLLWPYELSVMKWSGDHAGYGYGRQYAG